MNNNIPQEGEKQSVEEFVEKHLTLVQEENRKLWKRQLVDLLEENLTAANDDESGLETQGIYVVGIEEAAHHIINNFLLPLWKASTPPVAEEAIDDLIAFGNYLHTAKEEAFNTLKEQEGKVPAKELKARFTAISNRTIEQWAYLYKLQKSSY